MVWAGSLTVKDRAVVRIRDLPIVGHLTYLMWRKRRYFCEAYETFTETHPELLSGKGSAVGSETGF